MKQAGTKGFWSISAGALAGVLLGLCFASLPGCADPQPTGAKVRAGSPSAKASDKAMQQAAKEFYDPAKPTKKTAKPAKAVKAPAKKPAKIKTPAKKPDKIKTPAKKPAKIKKPVKLKKSVKAKIAVKATVKKTAVKRSSGGRKSFVSTAPWTQLAPPCDYVAEEKSKTTRPVASSKLPTGPGVWQPCKKKTAPTRKIAERKIAKNPAKKIAKKPVKKLAKKPVKKLVKKPVAKPYRPDWSWSSLPRLRSRSRSGREFSATTPWARLTPTGQRIALDELPVSKASLPTLPLPGRVIACELRVVRVADRKVISSASAVAICGNIGSLARALVDELARDGKVPRGASVVAVSLGNRQGSAQGVLLAETMTNRLAGALRQRKRFRFLKLVDLRDILGDEQKIESASCVTAPKLQGLMRNARYIIVGGIAMSSLALGEPAVSSQNEAQDRVAVHGIRTTNGH